ncbi:MAG: NADPH-dependent F420 reductase [Candidatus Dormibacteria bacterium]
MPPTIALIGGTGRLGPGLALRLAQAGRPVVIGSRDRERAEERAIEIAERLAAEGGGARVQGAANADAANAADMAILTVPYEAQRALLPDLAGPLRGKPVVSTAVPVRFDPELGPVAVAVAEGSAAEQAAALLPGSRIVAGFHTVSSAHLSRLHQDLDEDVIICGDDDGAKDEVRQVARLLPGVRVVDAGRLGNARHLEQLTVLLLGINRLSRRTVGVRLTGL